MSVNLERVSFKLWPALKTEEYDGWVLRFAEGYSRRSNSINPLGDSRLDLEQKLVYCADWLRDRNQPVVFKMTEFSRPAGLDHRLQLLGYEKSMVTTTMTLDLNRRRSIPGAGAQMVLMEKDDWIRQYRIFSQLTEKSGRILDRLTEFTAGAGFCAWLAHKRIVTLALGTVFEGWMGLFNLMVDPDERNRGYGRRAVQDLLNWGEERGCHTAFLQVVQGNRAAEALYGDLGFLENYRYWYRVKK